MKKLILLALAATLIFSCKKKSDDPQPAVQNGGTNGSGGTTTFSKTINFFQATDEPSTSTLLYLSKDQSNLTYRGSVGSTLDRKDACNAGNSNIQVVLTEAGRYYYQYRRGNIQSNTEILSDYFDLDANGVITMHTQLTSGQRIEYTNCYTGALTIFYQ